MNMKQLANHVLAAMVIAVSGSACILEDLPGDETAAELEAAVLPEQPDELATIGDEASGSAVMVAATSEPAAAGAPEQTALEATTEPISSESVVGVEAVSCTTKKYHTVGCIDCTGSGTVRVVVDCKAPQITDAIGDWTDYNGSVHLCEECNFGINSVQWQVK